MAQNHEGISVHNVPSPSHSPVNPSKMQQTDSSKSSIIISVATVTIILCLFLGGAVYLFYKAFTQTDKNIVLSLHKLSDRNEGIPKNTVHSSQLGNTRPDKPALKNPKHFSSKPESAKYDDPINHSKIIQFDNMLLSTKQGNIPDLTEAIAIVSEYLSIDPEKSRVLSEAIISAAATREHENSMFETIRYLHVASLVILKQYNKVKTESSRFLSMYPNSNYRKAVNSFKDSSEKPGAAFH